MVCGLSSPWPGTPWSSMTLSYRHSSSPPWNNDRSRKMSSFFLSENDNKEITINMAVYGCEAETDPDPANIT